VASEQQFVGKAAERKDVDSRSVISRAPEMGLQLFGRHERRRPDDATDLGESPSGSSGRCDSEIDQLDKARLRGLFSETSVHENVRWLHVAMNDALAMQIAEHHRHVSKQALPMPTRKPSIVHSRC
jgi:hypothetical protein